MKLNLGFQILPFLEEERKDAIQQAHDLLWENLEASNWWPQHRKLTENERISEKISLQFQMHHAAQVKFLTSFSQTLQYMPKNSVHEILQYGAGRRLNSIYEATSRFASIGYAERTEPLSAEEQTALGDSLLLIYLQIVGFFDALAIALHRSHGITSINERHSDLLKPSFRRRIESTDLDKVFSENNEWTTRIKEGLRNRYVHRLPPYVPPAQWTPEDRQRYEELQFQWRTALGQQQWERLDEIREEQDRLGTFFPFISFLDSNELMPLNPTILDDVLRFQVVAMQTFEILVPKLGLNAHQENS